MSKTTDRTVSLSGRIDPNRRETLEDELRVLARISLKPIKLVINSRGGDTREGIHLFHTIKTLGVPVVGVVKSRAASMAVICLQACERRLASPHARFLVHPITFEVRGVITNINYEELLRRFEECQEMQKEIYDILTQKTSRPLAEIIELLNRWETSPSDKEAQLTAKEALHEGLIDEII